MPYYRKNSRLSPLRGISTTTSASPLTLLSMDETTEFGIVEMGANHPGEIKTLCEIADPDFGIITNIGHAHLEGFGSYENIIATKKALYDYLLPKTDQYLSIPVIRC